MIISHFLRNVILKIHLNLFGLCFGNFLKLFAYLSALKKKKEKKDSIICENVIQRDGTSVALTVFSWDNVWHSSVCQQMLQFFLENKTLLVKMNMLPFLTNCWTAIRFKNISYFPNLLNYLIIFLCEILIEYFCKDLLVFNFSSIVYFYWDL